MPALALLMLPAQLRQADLPRDLLLLRNIKLRMKQNIARIPNYTCLETMVRTNRAPSSMIIAVPGKTVPFQRRDVVRFEVAEVQGHEMFAPPRGHDFRTMDVRELAPTGLVGNGSFSLITRDLFATNIARYRYAGDDKVSGRTLLRYDFQVSQLESGFDVRTEYGHAVVGYHGALLADPRSFDAVRVDLHADDVPPSLGIDQVADSIDYAPVRIGRTNALLPQGGEISMRHISGWESRNELTFTHCREYGVETAISFAEVNEKSGPQEGERAVDLPPQMQIIIRLETSVDSETIHTGDSITGRVAADVILKGNVIVRKDALVTGRLRRIEQHLEGSPCVIARLEFTEIEFEGKTARFYAELEKIVPSIGGEKVRRVTTKELPGIGALPGVGTLSVPGNRMVLPPGLRMVWKTLPYD
jgi:hypothetical protein